MSYRAKDSKAPNKALYTLYHPYHPYQGATQGCYTGLLRNVPHLMQLHKHPSVLTTNPIQRRTQ